MPLKRATFYLALIFLLAPVTLPAQQSAADFLKMALARADSNAFKAASKLVKKAEKAGADKLQVLETRARIARKKEDWGDLEKYSKKMLDLDAASPQGNYYRGIAAREKGKFKALLQRRLAFRRAEKHFRIVLEQDSLYRDIWFQLALLQRLDKKYQKSIQSGLKQIHLTPEQREPRVGIYALYRSLLRNQKESKYRNWLISDSNAFSQFFAAEFYRRKKKNKTAMIYYQKAIDAPGMLSPAAIYLALARVEFANESPVVGSQQFEQACRAIKSLYDADVVAEMHHLIFSDEEMAEFSRLQEPAQYKRFFEQLWRKRDPTPAAAYNIRLAEHFRRLDVVEKHYEFDGVRSWVNNPDRHRYLDFPKAYKLNHEYNDKGLVYIRHGQPNDRIATLGGFDIESNESWRYYNNGTLDELTFHFIIDQDAAGNNWRLSPILSHRAMIADRVEWGSLYYRMLNSEEIERLGLEHEMALESKASVSLGFETDRHTFVRKVKALETPFMISSFRGKQGTTELDFVYGFPLGNFKSQANEVVMIERGLSIQDSAWQPVRHFRDEYALLVDSTKAAQNQWLTDIYRLSLQPDRYYVAFHVEPQKTNLLGGANFNYKVRDFRGDTLMVSDLELAYSINAVGEAEKFSRHGMRIFPNATGRFSRKQEVGLYFEIYNLQLNADNKARFTIEYSLERNKDKGGGIKKVFSIFRRKRREKITVKTERQSQSPESPEFLFIDVSKADAGEYTLKVSVHDLAAERTVEIERPLQLF